MFLLVIPLIFGVLGAAIAASKNRNPIGWGLLCFLLPLLGLIILVFQKTQTSTEEKIAVALAGADMAQIGSGGRSSANVVESPKWKALVELDPEIADAADKARRYGVYYEALLAQKYLPLNDKQYLQGALEKVLEEARTQPAEGKIGKTFFKKMDNGMYYVSGGHGRGKTFPNYDALKAFAGNA